MEEIPKTKIILKRNSVPALIYVLIIVNLFQCSLLRAQSFSPAKHQVTFSFTLSGHLLLSVGYGYFFDNHNAVQVSVHTVTEKPPFVFGFNSGYNYYFLNKMWHPNIGAEVMLLLGPPDPENRRLFPMINIVPGIQYDFSKVHCLNGRLWASYMPTEKPFKITPTGIEFKYGYNLFKK